MPPNRANFGRRKIRLSTGIGRVKSPRRDRPSSDALGGSFGLGIEVVFDRLTRPVSQGERPIPWHALPAFYSAPVTVMPIIPAIVGQPDFNSIGFFLGDSEVQVGLAITAIVNFIIALFCFFVVEAYNKMKPPVEEENGPSEVELLTEIRDALRSR